MYEATAGWASNGWRVGGFQQFEICSGESRHGLEGPARLQLVNGVTQYEDDLGTAVRNGMQNPLMVNVAWLFLSPNPRSRLRGLAFAGEATRAIVETLHEGRAWQEAPLGAPEEIVLDAHPLARFGLV